MLQMPLDILLGTVVGGVGLVVFLSWALGGGRRARIADADAARAHWRATHPEAPVDSVTLGDDGAAALLSLADGGAAVVCVHGDRLVGWRLDRASIARVGLGPDHLTVHLRGFGRPAVTVRIAAPAARSAWHARLAHRP